MMDSIITNLTGSIRHPQRYAQNVLDEEHDERRPYDIPADDEEGPDDLEPDLLAIAIDGAARVGEAEGCATRGSCEETGADTADQCADEVGVEDVESVVNALEDGDVALAEIQSDL